MGLGWFGIACGICLAVVLASPARPRRVPVIPRVPFMPVVRGVLLWLAPFLPGVRYKVLLAWVLGGENGTKLSLHA